MRGFVKTIYIIGLLFCGGGALYSILIYISLDGAGTTGLVDSAENANIEIDQDSLYVYIDYTYYVGGKKFQSSYQIWKKAYNEYKPDTLVVKYNKYLPNISYIEQVPTERRSYKVGAIVLFIIFLFNFLLWNLSDREKWFRRYESIGDPPKLYPSSDSIKKKK